MLDSELFRLHYKLKLPFRIPSKCLMMGVDITHTYTKMNGVEYWWLKYVS